MFKQLKILNFDKRPVELKQHNAGLFTLQTCQRSIIIGLGENLQEALVKEEDHLIADSYEGEQAYSFLLKVICGLKSQLLAENEIVSQFKKAYETYTSADKRCTKVMKVLEKLFKDSKEVRGTYLQKVGQQSYAGVTRKILLSKTKQEQELKNRPEVLIVGSGQLSQDLIKLLSKRFTLNLTARNQTAIESIKAFNPTVQIVEWDCSLNVEEHALIVNTVGSKQTLFPASFFSKWNSIHSNKSFIDLGSPSAVETELSTKDDVMKLTDIFSHAQALDLEKKAKVDQAKDLIEQLAKKRVSSMANNCSWPLRSPEFV